MRRQALLLTVNCGSILKAKRFFSLSLYQVVTSKKRIFLNELPGVICRFLRGNCIFLPSILRTSKFDFFPGNINVAKKFPYFEHFPLGTALKSLNSLPEYCAAKMVTGQLLSLFPLYICLAPKGDINKRRKERDATEKQKKHGRMYRRRKRRHIYFP